MFVTSNRAFFSLAALFFAVVAALVINHQSAIGQTDAANERAGAAARSSDKRVLIEPYTGPPIMLDEKRVVVAPTIVGREPHTDKFPDGKTRVERQIARYSDDHREADGFYREFYPNGNKFIEGQYRQGRQDGEWSYYFENEQLNRKITYQSGRLHGQWDNFRADGTLAAKRSYENGLRHGVWQTYDAAGKQILQEENYVKGKPDGTAKEWFPSGQLKLQIGIKDGKRHGPTMQWDDKGNKIVDLNYVEDKLDGTATSVRPDGTKTIQEYKNGLLVSEKKG